MAEGFHPTTATPASAASAAPGIDGCKAKDAETDALRSDAPVHDRHADTAGNALTRPVLAALSAGLTLGSAGGNLMPELLSDFSGSMHLGNTEAGVVAAAQLLATAVTSIGLSRRADHPGRARLARLGALAAAIGFAASALAGNAAQLTAANVIAGAGLGALMVASTAGMASVGDPDRTSTVTVLGATVITALLLIVLPAANSAGGSGTGFLVLAACSVLVLPLCGRLPERPVAAARDTSAARNPGAPLLAGVALLAATDQGAWSYTAVLGEDHAHMSTSAVSTVLAAAGVIALAGIVAGSAAARRYGRFAALSACVIVEAAAKCTVAASSSPTAYAAATIVWQAGYLAVLVILLAAIAAADPSGRWIAAATGAIAVGTALGPPATGALLDAIGYTPLGVALAAATFIGAAPLLHMIRASPPAGHDVSALRKF
ncbi:MFS transporter [Embleya sp. NPDC020886]|uniref:MFS transporter n=1 Tax=Embleya sp. NPDC020886 TaxID=3363980 RepID=UPI0037A0E754